jgi:hypothetical protein
MPAVRGPLASRTDDRLRPWGGEDDEALGLGLNPEDAQSIGDERQKTFGHGATCKGKVHV